MLQPLKTLKVLTKMYTIKNPGKERTFFLPSEFKESYGFGLEGISDEGDRGAY
jgi:hypothetical protein